MLLLEFMSTEVTMDLHNAHAELTGAYHPFLP